MTQEGKAPTLAELQRQVAEYQPDMDHRLTELQIKGPGSEDPDDWAEWIIQQVQVVVEDGLPEVYNGDIYSFLLDLGMDMPWTESLAIRVGQAIVAHQDYQSLRTKFQKRFNTGFWEVDPDNPTQLHIRSVQ